jgi:hypothetical protein
VAAVVLLALLVVMCAGGLVMWTRLVASNTRIITAPGALAAGNLLRLFRGGVMGRHIITSGTLARLEFYDWGVRLRGTAISRWVVPTWEARYAELATVRRVALPASRLAVWLRVRGEPGSAIGFLCDHTGQILPVLEEHGVDVDRSVFQIRRVDELYQ